MIGRFRKITAACAALLTAAGIALPAAELLQNGNFSTGSLAPWASAQLPGNNPALQVVDGENGGKMVVLKGDPDNKYNGFLALAQPVPQLSPQKVYKLTGKFKASVAAPEGKQFRFAIRQENAQKEGIGYIEQSLDLSKKDWQDLDVIVAPRADAVTFQAYVIGSKLAAEDSVAFTDLSLKPIEAEEGEIVVNGGFEFGRIEPWISAQRGGGNKDLHTISTATRNGKYCVKVTGDPQNKYNGFIALVQRLPDLDLNKTYLLSCRVRCEVSEPKGKSLEIAIRQETAQKEGIGYFGVRNVSLTNDTWQHYEFRFRPNKLAARFDLYVLSKSLGAEDAIYVDDVSLMEEVETAKPFDPSKKEVKPGTEMAKAGVVAKIDDATGIVRSLSFDGEELQPEAVNSGLIFVQKGAKEYYLDGKGTANPDVPFTAHAEYKLSDDGIFTEIVTITATADAETPFKVGVRHGFAPLKYSRIVNALRPIRAIKPDKPTIYSYGGDVNDRNLGDLDQYQHVAFPMAILEDRDAFILAGNFCLDDFITFAPNRPGNSFPSLQRNPLSVKKGDTFRFETNYKRFAKSENLLRDVWRFYCDHLTTNKPELAKFIPPRITKERCFYRGPFGSSPYFEQSRVDRLFPDSSVWFYSWHDNISERYPTEGEWWSSGNSWKQKLSGPYIKQYAAHLQNDLNIKCIFYLRQLANLNQCGKEFPASWYKREAGGAVHLYGGGYFVNLPPHVAKEVGYDKIPLGSYDFSNPEYRDFYSKEIFKAMDYYEPKAIGWDMGSDIYEFMSIADTYVKLQERGGQIKTVANEGAGPTQPYNDMTMIENGMLGGKSADDFEVLRAYTTAVVCLERFNLFQLAIKANLDGAKTWLYDAGIEENKHYLDYLLEKHPEYRNDRQKLAQLCQLRACLYDLSMGASPGYMEEAKPVPDTLVRFAGDANGLVGVNKSFALRLPSGSNVAGNMSASAWQDAKQLRVVAFNNSDHASHLLLLLDRAHFAALGWSAEDWRTAKATAVTPEGEQPLTLKLDDGEKYLIVEADLEPFTMMALEVNK